MRHLGKKVAVCKNCLFPRKKKHVYCCIQKKTIKFAISHSFIFSISFNWMYSLEDSISIAVAEKENFPFFSLLRSSLSLFIPSRVTLPLSLYFALSSLPNFARKEEINDVAVTFNDLLRIILLLCLFLSTCC